MKTSLTGIGKRLGAILLGTALTWACSSTDEQIKKPTQTSAQKLQAQRTASAAENTQMISAAMDVFESTSASLVAKGIAGGKISSFGSKTASNGACLPTLAGDVNLVQSTGSSTIYSGTITLDYGAGTACTDVTQLHSGKITDSFRLEIRNADATEYTLTENVTFDGFEIDSVQVSGEFVGTSSPGTTSVKINNASLTYSDGRKASLNASLYSVLVTGAVVSKQVTGYLSGVSADGIEFSASSSAALIYDYSCSTDVPVAGTVDISIDGAISTLDYGSGLCDTKYQVTTNDSTFVGEFKYAMLK